MKNIEAQRKMLQELKESCDSKLQLEPDNSDILTLRGLILNGIESYDAAIADLDLVIAKEPDSEDAYYIRSDCYLQKKEYQKAKQDYLDALRVEHQEAHPLFFTLNAKEFVNQEHVIEAELAEMRRILEFEKKKIFFSFNVHFDD